MMGCGKKPLPQKREMLFRSPFPPFLAFSGYFLIRFSPLPPVCRPFANWAAFFHLRRGKKPQQKREAEKASSFSRDTVVWDESGKSRHFFCRGAFQPIELIFLLLPSRVALGKKTVKESGTTSVQFSFPPSSHSRFDLSLSRLRKAPIHFAFI